MFPEIPEPRPDIRHRLPAWFLISNVMPFMMVPGSDSRFFSRVVRSIVGGVITRRELPRRFREWKRTQKMLTADLI